MTNALQGFEMNLKLTSFDPWSKAKRKFRVLNGILPTGLMFSSFVPLFLFAGWLSDWLGITSAAPVRDQPNGLLWITVLLAAMVVMMITGALVGCVANALICRLYLRWSWQEVYAVHVRFQIPQRWQEALSPDAGGSAEAIERFDREQEQETKQARSVLEQGALTFVLRHGVLALGLPMFSVFYVLPVVTGVQTLDLAPGIRIP